MNASKRPVIIAYDGSAAAHRAVVETAAFLGSCQILVVTVWEEGLAYAVSAMPPDQMVMSPVIGPDVVLEVDQASHGRAETVAGDGAALARSLGLDAKPLAVPDDGDTSDTILRVAREHNAAAIVVGSRGLGGLRARLEGSTSKGLLKHALCPVIVVHEADEAPH